VCCAFSFCWWQIRQQQAEQQQRQEHQPLEEAALEKERQHSTESIMALNSATGSGLAQAVDNAVAILASLGSTTATRHPSTTA
jgi:cytoskeletal protein RodZ